MVNKKATPIIKDVPAWSLALWRSCDRSANSTRDPGCQACGREGTIGPRRRNGATRFKLQRAPSSVPKKAHSYSLELALARRRGRGFGRAWGRRFLYRSSTSSAALRSGSTSRCLCLGLGRWADGHDVRVVRIILRGRRELEHGGGGAASATATSTLRKNEVCSPPHAARGHAVLS